MKTIVNQPGAARTNRGFLLIFKAQRQPVSIYHNQTETPLFAKSIERHALGTRVKN